MVETSCILFSCEKIWAYLSAICQGVLNRSEITNSQPLATSSSHLLIFFSILCNIEGLLLCPKNASIFRWPVPQKVIDGGVISLKISTIHNGGCFLLRKIKKRSLIFSGPLLLHGSRIGRQ